MLLFIIIPFLSRPIEYIVSGKHTKSIAYMYIHNSLRNVILFIDQYRVKVEQGCTDQGSTPYGEYLLRVYDDVIKLFTPNGLLYTKFSCLIKDICEVKYQMCDRTMQRFVTLSVKSPLLMHACKISMPVCCAHASVPPKCYYKLGTWWPGSKACIN